MIFCFGELRARRGTVRAAPGRHSGPAPAEGTRAPAPSRPPPRSSGFQERDPRRGVAGHVGDRQLARARCPPGPGRDRRWRRAPDLDRYGSPPRLPLRRTCARGLGDADGGRMPRLATSGGLASRATRRRARRRAPRLRSRPVPGRRGRDRQDAHGRGSRRARAARGAAVATAWGTEADAPAYWSWTRTLRGLAQLVPDGVTRLSRAQRTALSPLMPELGGVRVPPRSTPGRELSAGRSSSRPCRRCSSVARRRARWRCSWTTCTLPVPNHSRCSSSSARRSARCRSQSWRRAAKTRQRARRRLRARWSGCCGCACSSAGRWPACAAKRSTNSCARSTAPSRTLP